MSNVSFAILLAAIFGCQTVLPARLNAGSTSSGGTQPSSIEYARTAIMTILEDQTIRQTLESANNFSSKGILSIAPLDEVNVWAIQTEKCTLNVKFTAVCNPRVGPGCVFSATALNDCDPIATP